MSTELKRSCMAFQLQDGNTLLISHEDVNEIATKIIIEGSLKKNTVIIKEADRSIEKANMLYNILKTEKDISQKTKETYLRKIGELLTSNEKSYINSKGEEVEMPNEPTTEIKIN